MKCNAVNGVDKQAGKVQADAKRLAREIIWKWFHRWFLFFFFGQNTPNPTEPLLYFGFIQSRRS
jgi:hypothetical protein